MLRESPPPVAHEVSPQFARRTSEPSCPRPAAVRRRRSGGTSEAGGPETDQQRGHLARRPPLTGERRHPFLPRTKFLPILPRLPAWTNREPGPSLPHVLFDGVQSSRRGANRYPMATYTSVRLRTGTVGISKAVNHRESAFLAPGRHDRSTIRLQVYFFLATRASRIAGR